jgi:hypothetical protein
VQMVEHGGNLDPGGGDGGKRIVDFIKVVGTLTGLQAGRPKNRGLVSTSCCSVQTGSGVHKASCPVGPRGKAAGSPYASV